MVSQHFRDIVKMGPKAKLLLWCLFPISEVGLLSFLEEYIAMRNKKS